MEGYRVLVVFYSRTGHTRKVAEAIARAAGADVEELIDKVDRRGFFGRLRCGFDAALRRLTTLERTRQDPAGYDLVILGTPAWGGHVSAALRTYMMSNYSGFKRVAFFVTHRGGDTKPIFHEMRTLAGQDAAAKLAVPQRELAYRVYVGRATSFVHFLLPKPPRPAPPLEAAPPPRPEGRPSPAP